MEITGQRLIKDHYIMPDDYNPVIHESLVSSIEIQPIVERIEEAISDSPKVHVLIALTTLMILIQNPNITAQQMYDGVKEISRFASLWLAGLDREAQLEDDSEVIDPKKLN